MTGRLVQRAPRLQDRRPQWFAICGSYGIIYLTWNANCSSTESRREATSPCCSPIPLPFSVSKAIPHSLHLHPSSSMTWWWQSDPQTPVLKPSDPTPDPIPTSPEPPSSPHEIADKPTKVTSHESQVQATLAQYLPVFSDPSQKDDAPLSSEEPPQKEVEEQKKGNFVVHYPETMSCRDAFDAAFYCSSFGGQFINVYRYGGSRSCSDHWSQFWWCMRNKSRPEETKKELIREFYRKKEEKYVDGPSSEDVWEQRTERVARAFDWDMDEDGIVERKGGKQDCVSIDGISTLQCIWRIKDMLWNWKNTLNSILLDVMETTAKLVLAPR